MRRLYQVVAMRKVVQVYHAHSFNKNGKYDEKKLYGETTWAIISV